MAIIFEEKRKINLFALGIIGAVILVVLAAVYYFFLVNPAVVEVIVPSNLKNLKETVNIKFDLTEISENPLVKNLKPYDFPLTAEPTFNPNPFR